MLSVEWRRVRMWVTDREEQVAQTVQRYTRGDGIQAGVSALGRKCKALETSKERIVEDLTSCEDELVARTGISRLASQ
jgi:hypothetical protein